MKTLDEVTKALSICGRHPNCEGCTYENVSYPTEIGNTCKDIMHYDALFYLKTIETMENLYHDTINKLSKLKDEDWKDHCLPLTWNELKQMIDSIVWLERSSNGNWAEITHTTDDEIEYFCFGTDELYCIMRKDYAPDKWQAYRKEHYESTE